jgi:GT2 family glycosyltransferase
MGAELLIVNCGGDQSTLARCLPPALPQTAKIVQMPTVDFNKSLALNLGAYQARSNVLLFLDADVILASDTVRRMLARLDRRSFITVARVIEKRRVESGAGAIRAFSSAFNLVLLDGRKAKAVTNAVWPNDGARSAPGLIMLHRHVFIKIGGMNSELAGWGWEDVDLVIRLQIGCGLKRICVGKAQHLSHSDEVRAIGAATRANSEIRNFEQSLANYAIGRFVGTYANDVVGFAKGCMLYPALEHSRGQKTIRRQKCRRVRVRRGRLA